VEFKLEIKQKVSRITPFDGTFFLKLDIYLKVVATFKSFGKSSSNHIS
jgi:hypothetical protein